MATHSSVLAWEIPWTEEPGGLQSTGLPRVRPDLAAKCHLRGKRGRHRAETAEDTNRVLSDQARPSGALTLYSH